MLKKTIKYVNFDGKPVERDTYFNISKSEILEQLLRTNNGWIDHLKTIGESTDGDVIMNGFFEILQMSYGIRSEDGESFRKSPELFDLWKSTAAYDAFFYELCTNATASTEFINGLLPAEILAEMQKEADARIAAEQAIQAPVITTLPEHYQAQQPPATPATWPPSEA